MSFSIISFDAAGTLIELSEPVGATYARIALKHGVRVREEDLKSAFRHAWSQLQTPLWPEGQSAPDDERSWWREVVAQVFANTLQEPLSEATLEPLFNELYAHFERPEAWKVEEDVIRTLDVLSRTYRLCVLSNFDRRLRTILKGHGLDRFFEHIILSSEVGASKPHPRMFRTAERLMNAVPEACLHVGDDARCDIAGAQACGWTAYAVARPHHDLHDLIEKVSLNQIRACE